MSLEKNLKVNNLIDIYGTLLGEKQFAVVRDYYMQDLGLTEIANSNNISRQAVLDLVKRCEKKLFNYEAKLHLVENKQKLLSIVSSTKVDLKQLKKTIEEL